MRRETDKVTDTLRKTTNGTDDDSFGSLKERVQHGNFEMEYKIGNDGVTIQIQNTRRRETMVTAPNTSPNTPSATGFRPLEERLGIGSAGTRTETRTAERTTENAGGTNGTGTDRANRASNGANGAAARSSEGTYQRSEQERRGGAPASYAAAPQAAPQPHNARERDRVRVHEVPTLQETYHNNHKRKHLKRAGFGLAGIFLASALIGGAYHSVGLYDQWKNRHGGGGNPAPAAVVIPRQPSAPENPYAGQSFDELYCAENPEDLQCVWEGMYTDSGTRAPEKQPEKATARRTAIAPRLSAIKMPAGKGVCHRLTDGMLAFQFHQPYQGFRSDRLYVADPEGMRVLPEVVMQRPGLGVERRDDCSYHQQVRPGVDRQIYNPVREARK